MTGIGAKWAVRRYQPSLGSEHKAGTSPLTGQGQEQIFDDWKDVVKALDAIIGDNNLQMGVLPTDPVVFQHGDDVVLIYMKLEF